MYIHRALEPTIRRYSEVFKAVVVTGPRQVGKTTMLRRLAEEEAAAGRSRTYVSLDNTAVRLLAREDPALFLQRYRPPVFIDEIQYAPELLPYIKLAVDESNERGLFWLTGSQPFHLMQGVSETLAGRAGIVEMLGLSGAELDGRTSEPFDPSPDLFVRRVRQGTPLGVSEMFERIAASSFPGIATLPADMRGAALDSYVDTYLMRDIRDLSHVADELKFRRFVAGCASLTGTPVKYAELARIADIDEKTAKAWLSLLVSSYLVKLVQPYENNLLKRLTKQPVMHFVDTGLAAHLAGWESPAALELGAMGGRVFESHVFAEIYKSYINAGKRPNLYFFRTNDKKEIDLLLERDATLYPIEVKKSALPMPSDTKNFTALDPVASCDVPAELQAFRRDVGVGCVVCLASDAYPINQRAWAMPLWAI